MTLLSMVNDLRSLLREETLSSTASTEPGIVTQKALVNRAARKVLGRHSWSFLQRNDGYLFFPARVTDTGGYAFGAGASSGIIGPNSTEAKTFSDGNLVAKIILSDSTEFPETSYVVREFSTSGFSVNADLAAAYQGTAVYTGGGTLYSNEAAFPATVARVLSIRNEEGRAITFETIDDFDDYDDLFPRDAERFGDEPEFVAVGGYVQTTSRTLTPAVVSRKALGIRIYPPPDQGVTLRYSYVLRPPTLTDDADSLDVPAEMEDHIVNVAFEEALGSNVEDDEGRFRRWQARNELEFMDLKSSDRRDAGRRHIAKPFGTTQHPARRPLWDVIPEP